MSKSYYLVRFERLASMFLEYEKDFEEASEEHQDFFTVDLQRKELKSLWDKVKTSYEKFVTNRNQIDSEKDCEDAKQLYKDCRLAYITIGAQLGVLSESFVHRSVLTSTKCMPGANMASNTVTNRSSSHHMKLPPCTMEVFKGDYMSWPSFRDMFTAVYINCDDLSGVEKLFYLRQFTSDEALEIVKNSPLTNVGFQTAWANLIEAYENKRIIVNGQLKVLFNLSPVKTESAKDIKRLQRDMNNSISLLNLYEVDISTWDPMFVYLCSINLPVLTLSLWEQGLRNKKELPKWQDLDNFLTSRFQSLETVYDIRNVSQNKADTREWEQFERGRFKGSKSGNNSVLSSTNRGIKTFQARLSKGSCVLCTRDHLLRFCSTFLEMNAVDRFLFVKKHNLCINCFSKNHKLEACSSKFSCSTCKLKHNSLLHREATESLSVDNSEERPGTSQAAARFHTVQNCFAVARQQVLLGTAMVNVMSRGEFYTVRALIDSGSQATFISEKLQRMLNLPVVGVRSSVSGLNGAIAGNVQKQCSFVLGSPLDPYFKLTVQGLVLPKLTGRLPVDSVDTSRFDLSDLTLADPYFAESGPVDILIGGDIYPQVMHTGVRKNILGNMMAQETRFGWILTGPCPMVKKETPNTTVSFYTDVSLDRQIERFWALEEPSRVSRFTPEDEYCEDHFRNMVHPSKYSEGRRKSNKMVCRVCLKDHPIRFCKKFRQVGHEERMRLVSVYRYCAGCLSHDHTWRTCESTGRCKRCGDMHHTLLHKGGRRPRSPTRRSPKRIHQGLSSSEIQEQDRPSSPRSSAKGPRSSNGHESERPRPSQALVIRTKNNHSTQRKQKTKLRGIVNYKVEGTVSIPTYHIKESMPLQKFVENIKSPPLQNLLVAKF